MTKSLYLLTISLIVLTLSCKKESKEDNKKNAEYLTVMINGIEEYKIENEDQLFAQYSSDSASLSFFAGQITFVIANHLYNGKGNYDGSTIQYALGLNTFGSNQSNQIGIQGNSQLEINAVKDNYVSGKFGATCYKHDSPDKYELTGGEFTIKIK